MLKAFHILGSSPYGFISHGWRPFFSVSTKSPLSCSSCSSSLKPSSSGSSFSPNFSSATRKAARLRAMSATSSEAPADGGLSSSTSAPSSSSSSNAAVQQSGNPRKVNFCQWCGGPTKHEIPDGEEKMRAICTKCGKITYQNPKMVVGCLIEHENKVLLCKRKIHPSYGLWTLPAGYLEIGESTIEGAMRETWEEAGAEVEVLSPFAQLDIPLIGQTYIIFLAKLKKPHFSPGPESLECRLYTLEEIPFDSLAFSSMFVTLDLYIKDMKTGKLKFHYGIINKRPGTSPSDIRAFTLDYHIEC